MQLLVVISAADASRDYSDFAHFWRVCRYSRHFIVIFHTIGDHATMNEKKQIFFFMTLSSADTCCLASGEAVLLSFCSGDSPVDNRHIHPASGNTPIHPIGPHRGSYKGLFCRRRRPFPSQPLTACYSFPGFTERPGVPCPKQGLSGIALSPFSSTKVEPL